jgi:uncharacterized membrane protein YeiH
MLLLTMYLVAIVAEAMTAALSAGRRQMDWVGVCLLGCITALGGGSLRDVLLGHYPLTWVAHPEYLGLTALAALITIAIANLMSRLRLIFLMLDGLGLVVFTIIGCNVARGMDHSAAVAIIAGMITGCAGGVMRDVLCNDVPLLFRKELYASVSIATGGLYMAGLHYGFDAQAVTLVSLAFGLAFRGLAILYNWHMPQFVYSRGPE